MEEDNNNYSQNQVHGSDDDSNDAQYAPRTNANKAPRTHRTSFTLSNNNTQNNRSIPHGTHKKVMTEMRHQPPNPDTVQKKIAKWRMRERMKTGSVALVYCLNIGVDPPDVIKTEPCARQECWIDPTVLPAQKALESIGKALQAQYERWQPRARYKLSLDPTVDEVKKLCISLRRNAKEERVLFHYCGHGVPKPTNNGEIWVFNKNYTQYIPLSIYELQTWMGSPSIYVFDSNAAGLIVHWFLQFAEQREKEYERMLNSMNNTNNNTVTVFPIKDFILLASCGTNDILPMNPELPADVFTSCLTTPIKMALRWFCSNSLLSKQGINYDLIEKIPGRLTDRKTPLGELNWIFTAITDTIAWNVLKRDLFQKLFRQDLLVASLFRNFLLAERIMRSLNCVPVSFPKLPPTYQHSMWDAWDLAVDICLSQVPALLADSTLEYQHSPFFTEQLTAFEVWLKFGSEKKEPPEQLPIVLQVLLSQTHRLRALELLGKFLDLGPWAVNLALSVGIFPYVLKLLQSPAVELRQILVFIWAKILALDKSCQLDLVKENGHTYFINVLATPSVPSDQRTMAAFILSVIANNCRPGQSACLAGNLVTICLAQLNDADPMLRRWCILCLAKLWEGFEEAKVTAIREGAIERIKSLLTDPEPEVRAAAVYSLGIFIGGSDSGQFNDVPLNSQAATSPEDSSPLSSNAPKGPNINLNSTSSLYSSGSSSGGLPHSPSMTMNMSNISNAATISPADRTNIELNIGLIFPILREDASPAVRKEVLISLLRLIRCYDKQIKDVVVDILADSDKSKAKLPDADRKKLFKSTSAMAVAITLNENDYAHTSVHAHLWKQLVAKVNDPFPELAQLADGVVASIVGVVQATTQSQQSRLSLKELPRSSSADLTKDKKSKKILGLNLSASLSKKQLGSSPPGSTPTSPMKKTSSTVDFLKLESDAAENNNAPSSSSSFLNLNMASASSISSICDEVPSNFYEWCSEYFSKPLMNTKEEEDETSPLWAERLWRYRRNQSILNYANTLTVPTNFSAPPAATAARKEDPGSSMSSTGSASSSEGGPAAVSAKSSQWKLDEQVGILSDNIPEASSLLLLHPFEPTVILADDKDGISVWDRDSCQKIVSFKNRGMDYTLPSTASGSTSNLAASASSHTPTSPHVLARTTAMTLLNEHDVPLLLTGSEDGVIRVWSGFEDPMKIRLVTAWKAIQHLQPGSRGSGLVFNWQQQHNLLFTSGDVDIIRIWDLEKEMYIQDIKTGSDSCVSCLASCASGSRTVAAGFGDGTVRLFDYRSPPKYSAVATMAEHNDWIVNVHIPKSDPTKIVSGCVTGLVKFWEYGNASNTAFKTVQAFNKSIMSAMAVHDYAPIFACGSQTQKIKVYNLNGEEVSLIRYHDGFLGQRIGPVSCLSFHPYFLVLGAGATDGVVSLYAPPNFSWKI